jgi:hypothetical protein
MKSMQFQFIRTLIPKMKLLQWATVLSIPKFPISIHRSSSSPSVFDFCFCLLRFMFMRFCMWSYECCSGFWWWWCCSLEEEEVSSHR